MERRRARISTGRETYRTVFLIPEGFIVLRECSSIGRRLDRRNAGLIGHGTTGPATSRAIAEMKHTNFHCRSRAWQL